VEICDIYLGNEQRHHSLAHRRGSILTSSALDALARQIPIVVGPFPSTVTQSSHLPWLLRPSVATALTFLSQYRSGDLHISYFASPTMLSPSKHIALTNQHLCMRGNGTVDSRPARYSLQVISAIPRFTTTQYEIPELGCASLPWQLPHPYPRVQHSMSRCRGSG
jgi:hypothetical protein